MRDVDKIIKVTVLISKLGVFRISDPIALTKTASPIGGLVVTRTGAPFTRR